MWEAYILNRKSDAGGVILPQIVFQGHGLKLTRYQRKNRHVDQRNRINYPEINPHNYKHLIFDKGIKNIHCGKTASLADGADKTGIRLQNTEATAIFLALSKKSIKNGPKTLM